MPGHAESIETIAARIRLLALDVDGVLTDGSIHLDDHGVETKRFNVHDGQGIATWLKLGFDVGIITKRAGKAVEHRMRELGVNPALVMQGRADKSAALSALLEQTGRSAAEVAYVGDDWPDMPVLARVGFPVAVADADERVKRLARLITSRPGGHGAVREAIEHLITAKGLMPSVIEGFMRAETGPATSA